MSFLLFNHLTIIAHIMHNLQLPEISKLHERFWRVSSKRVYEPSWTMCLLQEWLSLELLKLFHVFWALLSKPQRVHVKCCTKSHCQRSALPRSSHFSETLGLHHIFLNLLKAHSTVILHFVRLFVWVVFSCGPTVWGKIPSALEIDFSKGFQEKKLRLIYVQFGSFTVEKIKLV